jgi:hypothetical protein
VILLVFISAFRIVFYWGEKTARSHLSPAYDVSPDGSKPPIWWPLDQVK